MEISKVTSKTSSLKALVLKAWRERWTDLQWGIHIKTILPRGVSGDVYNLADCILQQALVGFGPNQLVLSYLKHCLCCQLVSHAAVLQRISKFTSFNKHHCVISLLELLETIQPGITCRGKPEEGVLASAVLSLTHWLLQCYQQYLNNSSELQAEILSKTVSILEEMLKCDFTVAMLYLGKHEDKDVFKEIIGKCKELEEVLQTPTTEHGKSVLTSIKTICNLEVGPGGFSSNQGKAVDISEPLTHCIQPLLAIDALRSVNTDTQFFVNQLLLVQCLKSYSDKRLYCELIRASMMCLNDALGTNEESFWGAFNFLKVPCILQSLHSSKSKNGSSDTSIVESFELLLQYYPLLDIMDTRCDCACIECFLQELGKINLITEPQIKAIAASREVAVSNLHRTEASQAENTPTTMPISKVIIKAEQTLDGMLMALDAEYSKILESIPGVLCHVLKSFELMVAVAIVKGKLQTFVSKLIKFNECTKHVVSADTQTAEKKAMLFDITFLMLVSIVQRFGTQGVLPDKSSDSFFEQWVRDCLIEQFPKPPDNILNLCDAEKVTALLALLNSPKPDWKMGQVRWHEHCINVSGAIKEVLIAWQYNALSSSDVKRFLDAMRSQMLCLPVCATVWLCSYMHILHQDELLKPMNMVKQFLSPFVNEEAYQQDSFNERSQLMAQIIKKMLYELHPPPCTKSKPIILQYGLVWKRPMKDLLDIVWDNMMENGWLSIEDTRVLNSLYYICGSEWLVRYLIVELMTLKYSDNLNVGVDMIFAIFHLDIEQCTINLLRYVTNLLHSVKQCKEFIEPQSSAVAKLCTYCIYAAIQAQSNKASSSRKRTRKEMEAADDIEEELCPTNKILRLGNGMESSQGSDSSLGFLNGSKSSSSSDTHTPIKEPLLEALQILFKSLSFISAQSCVSQRTHFVFAFIKSLVLCGKQRSKIVLEHMPNNLIPKLMCALPELFTTNLILQLYDLNTPMGRKTTARDLALLRNIQMNSLVVGNV
ncbi:unnamed protein product [Bemisia tabaci]|uniref:Mediator of RNA polymerase II transcription subunit 24 n=1 Tax=Bemisia tabaci TaxID=7038 RepID=A0A9P0ABU2_BEMTA|nr:unnamed protein product [Bemisia tabaci]